MYDRPTKSKETLPKVGNAVKERMRRVFQRVTGTYGNEPPVSMAMAMRAEGYAEDTARNPQQITRSQTWAEIMEEHLSQDKLGRIHDELLRAGHLDVLVFRKDATDAEIVAFIAQVPGFKLINIEQAYDIKWEPVDPDDPKSKKVEVRTLVARNANVVAPDNRTRRESLDLAYKLRGSYAAEKRVNENINYSLADLRRMKAEGKI